MANDSSRDRKDSPSDSPQRPGPAGGRKKIPPEADEQVIGQNTDPEVDRVGVKVPGGQIAHSHIVFQPLEKILERASLLMPFEDSGGAPFQPEIRCHDPIPVGDHERADRRGPVPHPLHQNPVPSAPPVSSPDPPCDGTTGRSCPRQESCLPPEAPAGPFPVPTPADPTGSPHPA